MYSYHSYHTGTNRSLNEKGAPTPPLRVRADAALLDSNTIVVSFNIKEGERDTEFKLFLTEGYRHDAVELAEAFAKAAAKLLALAT